MDLANGLRIELAGNQIWLADWEVVLPIESWPHMDADTPLSLPISGMLSLSSNCSLMAQDSDLTSELVIEIRENSDPWQAWLDFDRLGQPLEVRVRQPGDRFQPLGMGGHSLKLSDYMINQRIPRRARPHWPLLISAGAVAWVPGCTIGETFRVQGDTSRVLQVSLIDERRIVQPYPALS
jgi:tRNA(Ile)-lysidine synthase